MATAATPRRRRDVARVEPNTTNLDGVAVNYCDAFSVAAGNGSRASDWARECLRGADSAKGAFRHGIWHGLLGLDLAAPQAPGTLVGWQISTDAPERFVLDADGGLMRGRMVFEVSTTSVTWTTILVFHRRAGARIWAIASLAHRALAPRLLERAARSLQR